MKSAKIYTGKSIHDPGKSIEAINADYDTYLKEKIVCPFCYSPVYLRGKESTKMTSHWVHFPGKGIGCIAKSNPTMISIKRNEQIEREFRGQCSVMFKKHLYKIFEYAYAQEGLSELIQDYGKNWSAYFGEIVEISYNKLFPKYNLKKCISNIGNLLKNTTMTCKIIETFFEEILTDPTNKKSMEKAHSEKKVCWDDSFVLDLISGMNYTRILKQINILMELMKFFGNSDNMDVFKRWIYLNLVIILDEYKNSKFLNKNNACELFEIYTPEKIIALYCLYNLVCIDWDTVFKLLQKNEEPKVYVLIINNFKPLEDFLYLCNEWQPIKLKSNKGFSKF